MSHLRIIRAIKNDISSQFRCEDLSCALEDYVSNDVFSVIFSYVGVENIHDEMVEKTMSRKEEVLDFVVVSGLDLPPGNPTP